ncbi:MAG: toxic protein SymE [Vicingaceae bacterium]|jgi:toxic protein SymE
MAEKKNIKTTRLLKIISKTQPREYHKYVCVPEIKLVGKWLRNSGFKEGEFVKVEVRKKKIVITLDEEKSR